MSKNTASLVEDSAAFKQLDVGTTETVPGRKGRNAMFQTTALVKMGDWFNAAKSELIFSGDGEVTGMASAHNCEIYLPNKISTGGSYTALECNYNFQASTALQTSVPQCIASFKVGGTSAKIDAWEDEAMAGVFSFQGLTANDASVFALNASATIKGTLKIMIGTTAYYLLIATSPTS